LEQPVAHRPTAFQLPQHNIPLQISYLWHNNPVSHFT
jgi:hypothetical protein